MKRALLTNVSLCARNLLPNLKPIPNNPALAALTRSRLSFYSSESESDLSIETQTRKLNDSVDVDDVSNQELKRRIEKYFEGDEDAIPSIFEAILTRKLAGKHEESDDELMAEFKQKTMNDVKDDGSESDFDEFSETDDLGDAKDVVMKRRMKDEG